MKLELELIPEGSWGKSLARLLPRPVWDTLRREVYQRFNYTCAICGNIGVRVNCHEVWRFEDRKHLQHLADFQCLCDDCHNIKHWGRTVALVHEGQLPQDYLLTLTRHFCEVNNCTEEDFGLHKVEMGNLWGRRSRHRYTIDFGKFEPERVITAWRKRQDHK